MPILFPSQDIQTVIIMAYHQQQAFLTYQDPVYGIKIQYPSNWEKIQLGKNFIVGFVSASRHDSGVLKNLMVTAPGYLPPIHH